MALNKNLVSAFLGVGLLLSGTLAASQTAKPPAKKANAGAPKKNGQWAQEKGACEGLDSKAKELTAQEKQLYAQAKEKETEARSLIAQAAQIEKQRVAEEHSVKKGDAAGEARLKSQEEQRVSLEHQATEKQKEREGIIKQAEGLAQERKQVEAQHRQDCTLGKGKAH